MNEMPHGTLAGYDNHRCRCPECTRAKATHMREYRAGRAKFVVDGVHPTAPHGTATGYDTYRCRCDACLRAKSDQQRELRVRLRGERVKIGGYLVHPRAKHGTSGGYVRFNCRCSQCRRWERDRTAARRRAETPPRP